MSKQKKGKIDANGIIVNFFERDEADFFSLTDIVKSFDENVLYNWLRNRNTIEYLGLWEQLYNPNFNTVEFDRFRFQSGSNTFTMSAKKWVSATNAIGIFSKAGRYNGGTYAHKDIALEFCSWLNPAFKLHLIQDYQKLKAEENIALNQDWTVRRTIAKINYKIQTEAVKRNLIPPKWNGKKAEIIYANEADLINLSLFGLTAKEWKGSNSDKQGNIRDFATMEQLVVLSNLQSLNAEFIKVGLSPEERLERLNEIAIEQMELLTRDPQQSIELLKEMDKDSPNIPRLK